MARDPALSVTSDDRAPVLVGAGERLLRRADALAAVPSTAWPDGDPGRRVNALLGTRAPTLRSSMQGGNGPQLLVNLLGARIAAGQLDVAPGRPRPTPRASW